MNSIAWLYLPYFAFLGTVIAGLHYENIWVVVCGLAFTFMYNIKPELEILCKHKSIIFNNCKIVSEEQEGK